jgi:hypothetical protein
MIKTPIAIQAKVKYSKSSARSINGSLIIQDMMMDICKATEKNYEEVEQFSGSHPLTMRNIRNVKKYAMRYGKLPKEDRKKYLISE